MDKRIFSTFLLFITAIFADNPQPYQQYDDTVPNYQFKYEVKDTYSGNDFGQEEARSGYNTDGEYTVLLPDGRKQIVTYKVADSESGFVADVRYEGEPNPEVYAKNQRPAYKPEPRPYGPQLKPQTYTTARPTYNPRPSYRPSPTYGPALRPTTTPTPYKPTPAPYKPTPAPYHPTPAPYHPTPAPYHPTPAPYHPTPASYGLARSSTYAPSTAAPEADVRGPYNQATTTPTPVYTESAPTYNPAKQPKQRMKYPKKLENSEFELGSLFYGNVKGKVRAPVRRSNPVKFL